MPEKCPNKAWAGVGFNFGMRKVPVPCGMRVNGKLVFCDRCLAELIKTFPQGWVNEPGDICEHGVFTGSGIILRKICAQCERW